MYRCGIIGLGRIGVEFDDSHAMAYIDCEDTDLVALCDSDSSKFTLTNYDRWIGQWVQTFTDYLQMVKPQNLDIVSVCTPIETHCQIVCDIAPYVKAIYCEKPMATTVEECDRMIEVCEKNNVILQINHQRRFYQPIFTFNNRLTTLVHVFDLIRQYNLDVNLVPVDADNSIFDLKLYDSNARMVLMGVEHLVECLRYDLPSVSNGYGGRESLRRALEYMAK